MSSVLVTGCSSGIGFETALEPATLYLQRCGILNVGSNSGTWFKKKSCPFPL